VERDACGRPFLRGADPLAEAPAAPTEERGHFEWLIRVLQALGREAGPPMGKPMARLGAGEEITPTHPPPLGAGEEIR
jgi:hypothetical protein